MITIVSHKGGNMKIFELASGQKLVQVDLTFFVNESEIITLLAKNFGIGRSEKMTRKKLLRLLERKLRVKGESAFKVSNMTRSSLPLAKAKKALHSLLPEIKTKPLPCRN